VRKKIKIDYNEYKKLVKLMGIEMMLQEAGKAITKKAENIISTLATYGVEVPKKRIDRISKENRRSIKWVNFD